MTFTFGGATGDDTNASQQNNVNADNTAGLMVGMFYPTTLTATRCYWGCGNNGFRAQVDATTSEIRMITVNATTNGQWLTSGAGITTNQWWFIAWMWAFENTTVAGDWRVWVGTETQPPTEVTVTNPTPRSGNYSNATNLTAGNAGSGGTSAWQGDIGWLSIVHCANASAGVNALLPIAASGVIDNDEADHVLKRWVIPFYQGRPRMTDGSTSGGNTFHIMHFPMTPGVPAFFYGNTATGSAVECASAGLTLSGRMPFAVPPPNWPVMYPLVLR